MRRMKIFFTASFWGKDKYQKNYDLVLSKIEENNITVVGTEKGNYQKLVDERTRSKLKDEKYIHYEAVKRGILWSDAVIIENSHEDFQLGHEATLAIQAKKPVLCLSIYENFALKINNKYFFGAKYNEYNVGEVIREFLSEIKKEKFSERFNCFLSSKEIAYLEGVSKKHKMNKSEYLRKLIDEDMRIV